MEEDTNENNNKNNGKISITLSSLALGTICILLLIAAMTLLYTQTYTSKDNITLKAKIRELENENKKMHKLIKDMDLEEYLDFDEIEKIDNNSNNYGYDSLAAKDFTEEQIKQSIKEYMEIDELFNNQFDKLLVKLDLVTEYEAEQMLYDIDETHEFVVTNVKYEDFKNAMLKYMTDIVFQNNFADQIKSKDGRLCFSSYNLDYDISNYEITKLEKDTYFSKNNGYVVTYKYNDSYEQYDIATDEYETVTEDYEASASFVVTALDGICIISYTDF